MIAPNTCHPNLPHPISPSTHLNKQLGVGPLAEGEGPAVLRPRPIVGTFVKPVLVPPMNTSTASDGASAPNLDGDSAVPGSSDTASADGAGESPGSVSDAGGHEGASSGEPATADRGDALHVGAVDGQNSGVSESGNSNSNGSGVTPPTFFVARAACGLSHTVLISTSGEAWSCGRNRSGQLGIDPAKVAETFSPVKIDLPSPSGDVDDRGNSGDEGVSGACPSDQNGTTEAPVVVQAAAGTAHTMLLLSNGRVLGFGSDEFGALGSTASISHNVEDGVTAAPTGGVGEEAHAAGAADAGSDDGTSSEESTALVALTAAIEAGQQSAQPESSHPSWHWRPREINGLRGRWVASISAGGEQSFAIVVASQSPSTVASPSASSPSPPLPPLPTEASTAGVDASKRSRISDTYAGAGEIQHSGGSTNGDSPDEATSATACGSRITRQGSEAMFMRRRFSLPPSLRMRSAEEFLALTRKAMDAKTGDGDKGLAEAVVLEVGSRCSIGPRAIVDNVSHCQQRI